MLPDFPTARREIEEIIAIRLREAVNQRNVLARLATSIVQHEGTQMAHDQLTKEGKRVVASDYERAEAGIRIAFDEIPDLVGDRLSAKLDEIADDIAGQTSRAGFKKIEETIQEAGGGLDAAGQPLTPELYLEGLERMEINFDPETLQPTFTIIIHPAMAPAFEKLKEALETNSEFKRRYDELMARKLKDWRDRESCRRLVD